MGHSPAGLFGYSHLLGGFAGGQAEYLRVPFADVGPIKIPSGLSDDQVLFLSDIFPTGYMAADFCDLKGGETVAIWGCGPVGQFAIKSAFLLGAERVIAIDTVPERLALAEASGAVTLDFMKEDVYDRIQELTSGRGADACIDAVGTEPETRSGFDAVVDRVRSRDLHGHRPAACAPAGDSLLPKLRHRIDRRGLWRLPRSKFRWARRSIAASPFAWRKRRYSTICRNLLERVEKGEIDPSFVITHHAPLEQGPESYKTFRDKKDGCIKVVLKP